MKITKKEKVTYVNFGDLKDGDTFTDPEFMEGAVLIKCGTDWDDLVKDDEEFDCLVVRLDNGDIFGYRNDEKVVKVTVSATFTEDKEGE